MALSAKRLVSKTQKVSTSPQPSAPDPKGQTIARQNAAKSEIDSLLQDLLQSGDDNGGISLSDTLIQAAHAEVESGNGGNISSDPLGSFILPEGLNAQPANTAQSQPTVEISVPPQPEPTVKIPVPPPSTTPKPVPAPAPTAPKTAKRSTETKTQKNYGSDVGKVARPTDAAQKPGQNTDNGGKASNEAGKGKKQSSLPAVIVLIILLIIAGYVVFAYIIPAFSESKNDGQSATDKQSKANTPAGLVSNTVEVVKAANARNKTGDEEPVTVTVLPPAEKQEPEPEISSDTTQAVQVENKPKKKKKKEEEIIDIPFEDDELPPEYQPRPWPDLSLTAVIAKGKKGDGFATVNGETLCVGDETSSGVKLISVAVNPPRAVFKFDGREQTVLVSNKGE